MIVGESKPKEIIYLTSKAFEYLYGDDIESLRETADSIREKLSFLVFEDFQFTDEMLKDLSKGLSSIGKEIDEEETKEVVIDLFVKFIEIAIRSSLSLMAYTMKDVVSNYAKRLLNHEDN